MTLQLYILRQLLYAAGFSLLGISMLVMPSVAIQAIYKLGGVSLSAIADYLPLVIVELVPYLLPMAFLLGVVATYGRLGADHEWTAIRMAGIHPTRVLLPGLLIAIPLGLGTNWLLSTITPEWKYLQRTFIRRAEEEALKTLGQGRTEFAFGNFSIKADRRQGPLFEDVILSLPDKEGEEITLIADRAEFAVEGRALVVRFEGAQALTDSANPYNQSPELRLSIDELSPFRGKDKGKAKYLTSAELQTSVRSGELDQEKAREFVYEIHRRHALSATYLVFLLLGIPTGLHLRSGTQLSAFTGAVGYAFFYYVLALRLGKELAVVGTVPPLAAAWATNALFAIAAFVLLRRVLWR